VLNIEKMFSSRCICNAALSGYILRQIQCCLKPRPDMQFVAQTTQLAQTGNKLHGCKLHVWTGLYSSCDSDNRHAVLWLLTCVAYAIMRE